MKALVLWLLVASTLAASIPGPDDFVEIEKSIEIGPRQEENSSTAGSSRLWSELFNQVVSAVTDFPEVQLAMLAIDILMDKKAIGKNNI